MLCQKSGDIGHHSRTQSRKRVGRPAHPLSIAQIDEPLIANAQGASQRIAIPRQSQADQSEFTVQHIQHVEQGMHVDQRGLLLI